jgi:hypothetical protein
LFSCAPGDHLIRSKNKAFDKSLFDFPERDQPNYEKRTLTESQKSIAQKNRIWFIIHSKVRHIRSMAAKKCGIPCIINSITVWDMFFRHNADRTDDS